MILTIIQKEVANGLFSNRQQMYVTWMFACVYVTLGAFGVVTNTINIRTFVRMGLGDSVTLSFLVLSLSDLGYLLTTVSVGIFSFFWAVEMDTFYKTCFGVDPFGGYVISANVSFLLYVMSMLATVFLAVARCMCVVRPLHFKAAFTLPRTVAILVSCAVFTVGSYLPVLTNMGVVSKFDARVNFSRPLLWITTEREFIKVIVWAVRDTLLSLTSQVVILVCVFIMATKLRKATEFRQISMAHFKPPKSRREESSSDVPMVPPLVSQATQLGRRCIHLARQASYATDLGKRNVRLVTQASQAPELGRRDVHLVRQASQATQLGKRDVQIIRQVLLISLVYAICNVPKILVNIAGMFEPELTIGKQYQNLSIATINIMNISQMFHSSINLVIYYKFNAKFRTSCAL